MHARVIYVLGVGKAFQRDVLSPYREVPMYYVSLLCRVCGLCLPSSSCIGLPKDSTRPTTAKKTRLVCVWYRVVPNGPPPPPPEAPDS